MMGNIGVNNFMKKSVRRPDIENLYKVLKCQKPDRPTLFELFLNQDLYEYFAGRKIDKTTDPHMDWLKLVVEGYAGVTARIWLFCWRPFATVSLLPGSDHP
jgi:hypothetical protein